MSCLSPYRGNSKPDKCIYARGSGMTYLKSTALNIFIKGKYSLETRNIAVKMLKVLLEIERFCNILNYERKQLLPFFKYKATYKRTHKLPILFPNNVGSCCVRFHAAKSLTGFKLCTTIPNNTQQHSTGCANRRNM